MKVSPATLEKLDFSRVRDALAERAASALGSELALRLAPSLSPSEAETAWERLDEAVSGPDLSLGGVHDIRPLVERSREGRVLEGKEILEMAYTMDAAGSIKRAVLASERPALSALASSMSSFDAALRLIREQLDTNGGVRDDATPKLRDIRRRLQPLRGRIRDLLNGLLDRYRDFVQDPIITIRRERYVIPIKAASQSRVPGIVLDRSDSGATVFVEPQSAVPLNNELALLELEERDEVRRILAALGHRLANEPKLDETIAVLAELDLIAASARLVRDWELSRPTWNRGGQVGLADARHPLIQGCVPNSIGLTPERRLLVVTGPNAGGKTVLLKTLGLAVLMAHSGLFVAAAGEPAPSLPHFAALLVDIGDEQSIAASLSTYAGHLNNLNAILSEADEGVLVLIDELGSGTDPSEGAALSQAILEQVLASGARGLVTTHLAPLKAFASNVEGVQNAAMAFDVEGLQPRFAMTVGQPGRSYALAIAERLGLPRDLLVRARELLGPEGTALEALLETLQGQRDQLERELAEARAAREKAEGEAALLREQISSLRAREREVMAQAAARAEAMLRDTMQRAKELKRTATTSREQRGDALEELQSLRREVQQQAGRTEAPRQRQTGGLVPGTVVRVESYAAQGPVVEVRGDDVVVQLGLLKVEVPRREVRRVVSSEKAASSAGREFAAPSRFETELNIRGERAEDGVERVREFILEACAMRVPSVRIVHGKGTGNLRDAVRNYLKDEKRVYRFEDAVPYEGGHGVTVAHLRV